MSYYTGIGSRTVPAEIKTLQTKIARFLSEKGYILRSGGADGSDKAFEAGAEKKEIYLPWLRFNGNDGIILSKRDGNYLKAYSIVERIHPAPKKLTTGNYGTVNLHIRNVYQVIGNEISCRPSKFVIFYAEEDENGVPKGGTRTAVMYARELGIPTYNLWKEEERKRIINIVKEGEQCMPKVNGKSFRCDCGCNVFTYTKGKYICNCCREHYTGE